MGLNLSLVALGGAFGSVLRYLLGLWASRGAAELSGQFPIGTFAVNVLGCLAIGAIGAWLVDQPQREHWRLLLVVGVLGGFTTFSAFGWETIRLINADRWGMAMVFVLATNATCLLAAWAGSKAVTRWS